MLFLSRISEIREQTKVSTTKLEHLRQPGLLPRALQEKVVTLRTYLPQRGLVQSVVTRIKGCQRPHGRPKTSFSDNIREWTWNHLGECVVLVRDGLRWKSLTRTTAAAVAERHR